MKLVYDYAEGYVVDAETGEVVDRVYDYSPPRRTGFEKPVEFKPPRHLPGKRLGKLVGAYRRALHYEERGYAVDFEKLARGIRVKTLKHERSIKAEKYFSEKGLLEKLSRVVEELDAKGVTSGLSIRSRLVLAYVLYKLSRGETPKYGELRDIVSESTFRRIKRKAKKMLSGFQTGR